MAAPPRPDRHRIIADYKAGVPLKVLAFRHKISQQRVGRIALDAGAPSRRMLAIMRKRRERIGAAR